MIREPFLRTRAGRVSLLAMLVVDVFILPVLMTMDAVPLRSGDALPRTTVMRAIPMAQALTGQLYVAVLIARFVKSERANGREAA